jgi:hypothetical protein
MPGGIHLDATPSIVDSETMQPVGAPEHAVFCRLTWLLSHLTGDVPVLCLCRGQEREAARYYFRSIASHRTFLHRPAESAMGLALGQVRMDILMLIRRYVDMLSDEVQELFFSLWQVAHELERRGCLARVFEFEPLETRQDALDSIAEESLWANVLLPRFFVETAVLQSTRG